MPFMVLMQSENRTDRPEFVHLDGLDGISDEVTLGTACNFALHLPKTDMRFMCATSTDYQDWMHALEIAYGMIHASSQQESMRPIAQVGLESAIPVTQNIARPRTASYHGSRSSMGYAQEQEIYKKRPGQDARFQQVRPPSHDSHSAHSSRQSSRRPSYDAGGDVIEVRAPAPPRKEE
jgi:hypothetical protein